MDYKTVKKISLKICKSTFPIFAIFQVYLLLRSYVFASCVIPTNSMSPTLINGDYMIVSLRIPGRRVWKQNEKNEYEIERRKGSRDVRVGDVVVFNFPYAHSNRRMVLRNDSFYCKRCTAIPGQTYNWEMNGKVCRIYLPKKGDEVKIDESNAMHYYRCIEYETGDTVRLQGRTVLLGDSVIHIYRFKHDYYFMEGDNALASYDSRFWGLLPDDFIWGIGRFIWFSQEPKTWAIRWNRILKEV